MSETANLESIIKYYSKLYYEGTPAVNDDAFDYLIDKLRKLNPKSKILTTVGWGYKPSDSNPSLKIIKHQYDLAKFEGKIYDPSLIKVPMDERVVTPKYDGGSIILYYKDGILENAVTRGDGVEGFDVTANFSRIVPTVLTDHHFSGMIRGEGIMKTKIFEEKYKGKGYESARNLSTGWARKSGISEEDIHNLSFVAYTVRGKSDPLVTSHNLNNKEGVLEWLSNNHFDTAKQLYPTNWDKDSLVKLVKEYRKKVGIDGIVITSKSYDKQSDGTYVPKREVAYKIKAQTKEVTVKNIDWEISRTGKLVPVVEFDPVILAEASVQKATGFNADFIKRNKIGVGAKIIIQRSGEVIPNIVDVSVPVTPLVPSACPSCKTRLTTRGTDLWCLNEECPIHLRFNVKHYIKIVAPVKSLGDSLLDLFIDNFSIKKVPDLYKLSKTEIKDKLSSSDGVGDKSLELFYKMTDKLNSPVDTDKFLVGLNLRGLSYKAAEKLHGIETCKDLRTFVEESGVNKTVKYSLIEGNGINLVESMLKVLNEAGIKLKSTSIKNNHYVGVALTGKLSISRKALLSKLADKDIKEVPVKKAKFLILGESKSISSKHQTALDNDIPIVTEDKLDDYIKDIGSEIN